MSKNGTIKYITLRIPIYTGTVPTEVPKRIESRTNFRLLESKQTEALNRMHQAYVQQHSDPMRDPPSQNQVMRHILTMVGEECRKKGVGGDERSGS